MTPEERAALRALAETWRGLTDGISYSPSVTRIIVADEAGKAFLAALTPSGAVDLLDALDAAEIRLAEHIEIKHTAIRAAQSAWAERDAARSELAAAQDRLRQAEAAHDASLARERAMREAAADLLSRMEEPGCAIHTLGAFLHGSGVANMRAALSAAPPLPEPPAAQAGEGV